MDCREVVYHLRSVQSGAQGVAVTHVGSPVRGIITGGCDHIDDRHAVACAAQSGRQSPANEPRATDDRYRCHMLKGSPRLILHSPPAAGIFA